MFANYFKTALRNILRHRVHALINFVGLAAAMAAAILILLFVVDDLRFDTFHRHADRIFRVIKTIQSAAAAHASAINPEPLAAALKKDLPEVEEAVVFEIVSEFPPAFRPSNVTPSAPLRSINGAPAVVAPPIVRAAPPTGLTVIAV